MTISGATRLVIIRMNVLNWTKNPIMQNSLKDETMLLMTHVDPQENEKEDVWFLDSGCSNHMSGNRT